MKITDGKRTVEINIMTWNGTGYGPDWAEEYFNAGMLPHDEETDTYTVQDVQYCIDMADDTGEEGARCKCNNGGEYAPDDNTEVFVTEL
jgi:hypothetical protein